MDKFKIYESGDDIIEHYGKKLSASRLFRSVIPGELSLALELLRAKLIRCRKNEYIVIDEDNTLLYFVLEGGVRLMTEEISGERVILGLSYAGETFRMYGETAVSAVTSEKCILLRLDLAELFSDEMLEALPDNLKARLRRNFVLELDEKLREINERISLLSQKTIRKKLLAYFEAQSVLTQSKTFTIPLDRAALADYLGADRSAMSRELSRMKRDGLIDYSRSSFKLL